MPSLLVTHAAPIAHMLALADNFDGDRRARVACASISRLHYDPASRHIMITTANGVEHLSNCHNLRSYL